MGTIRPAVRAVDPTRGSTMEIAIDFGRREPLVPGEPVVLRFSLTAGPVLLRAGETLRLDVGSRSDLLRKDSNGGYPQFDLPVPPFLARNTLHFGGNSWVEVTAVPTRSQFPAYRIGADPHPLRRTPHHTSAVVPPTRVAHRRPGRAVPVAYPVSARR
jgi:hypothetical protein